MFSRSESGKYSQLPLHERNDDDSTDDEDDFIQQSIKNQQQLMKKQDEGLEFLSESAHRLTQMSLDIHEELGQQDKMLDEMEMDLDKATTNLDLLTEKTKEMVKRAGGRQNCMLICGLTLVAIILFLLILYT